jgi:penicillin-binding protein 2
MYTVAKSLRPKLAYLLIGIGCAFLIIGARLVYLQIHLVESFFTRSQKNFLRIEKVPSPRGNIIDCNGALLVTNRPVAHVYWQGSGKKNLDASITKTLSTITTITGTPLLNNTEFMQELTYAERHCKKILLAADISFEQLSKLEEQFPNHNNITVTTQFERFYPHHATASHILGYLSHIDVETIGKMGLEKLLDESLKGEPGSLVRTINSFGRHLSEVETKKALAGHTIQTTLNLKLQQVAEQVFPAHQAGTLIVMNPADGSLVTLVSRPDFDPALFLQTISHEQWQALQDKRCFLNRAFNSAFPPGSIFKLVTISAALEQRLIAPDACVMCLGHTTYCGRQYRCAKREGHGPLSIGQAVAHSCNILFYDIGKHIDIDTLASYARMFGLGQKTNIMFTEKDGLIPTRQWKRKTFNERWWQGETLSAAIGQSFLLVTPIQVARMISSIFTGYLVKPRIVATEEVVKVPLALRPETLAFLRRTMKLAVTDGTGQRVNHIKHIEIYGKTSTAQTSQLEKRELGLMHVEHGWFVAHFKYKDHKSLVMVILLENVGSSRAATEVAKNFLIEYKKAVDA